MNLETFDPLNLDNRVSLNRTPLAGYGLPAHELLASYAMGGVSALEMPQLAGTDPIAALDAALLAKDVTARSLAARFGTYLGAMLLTLLTVPGEDAYLRSYRAHWASMRRVYLGGGISRGALGLAMRDAARLELDASGLALVALEVAPNAALLPLIGAARSVGPGVETAAVFDFGGSSVKRGVATYERSQLKSLRVLPAIPSMPLPPDELPEALADFMTDVLATGVAESGASSVAASVACYMRDGHPLDYGSGGYQLLRRVTDNTSLWLSDAVSQRLGAPVEVALSHDGTTAARAFAGQPRTAVVMLGTWIGVGFAPEDASGFRPIAPDFQVSQESRHY